MPGILFRHIFVELVKVLVVTTSVLVTVIAFGAAIKPLAENLLGPAEILKYMAYATVPMLQFALPFAAAFAGVIVYHRLTTDNEIVAMAASGIPYRRILLPAVVLGVALTLFMTVLVGVGVPWFVRAISQLLAKDVTRGFVAYVQRGEALTIGSSQIYADEAHVEEAPADSGAAQRLLLVGVAALEFASQAEMSSAEPHQARREFTAQFATVDVHRVGVKSFLKVVLQNATVFTRGDHAIAGSAVVRPEAIDLGRTIDFGMKGRTFFEMLELRKHLEREPEIASRRNGLLAAIAAADAWQAIADAARSGEPIVFKPGSDRDASHYEVRAAELVGTELVPAKGQSIEIRQIGADGRVRSDIVAPRAVLTLDLADLEYGARFDLVAEDAITRDSRAESGAAARRAVRLPELALNSIVVDSSADSNDELLARAEARAAAITAGPIEPLRVGIIGGVEYLSQHVRYVSNEIIARSVQRVSTALTAILMLLCASIFAIWLRNRPPLFVYVLAFVPAIADILLVSSGEQMLRGGFSVGGVILASSGNAMLLVACVIGAWRVGRH